MTVRLRLLGTPAVECDGRVDALAPERPVWLLAYLAARGDWVSREEIATLMRPDAGEDTARDALRLVLHRARKTAWAFALEVGDRRVRFRPQTDLACFEEAVQNARWAKALEVYGGVLLQGFPPPNPALEGWCELERERLRGLWQRAVLERARELEALDRTLDGLNLLEHLIRDDALTEDAVQLYLGLARRLGARDRGLACFERFCRTLADELGLEPLPATRALADALASGHDATAAASQAAPTAWPQPPSGLVGREAEVEAITARLLDPEVRLVSVVGLGGSGKTRLCLEVGRVLRGRADHFRDGAVFVGLTDSPDAAHVPTALATALGVEREVQSGGDLEAQVLDALRWRQMLLVLDNLEHLPGVAALIERVLERAPGVRVLATSRVRLNLRAEWVIELDGLDVPRADDPVEHVEHSGAVRLFLREARRQGAAFGRGGPDLGCVARICRSVGGSPLALEIAARWARVMDCARIETELSRGLELLRSDAHPDRHASVRAVLNASWSRLGAHEQGVLEALSVFRGASLEAALELGACLPTLLALSNAVLLRHDPHGRFEMHELVRAHALERLNANPAALEAARDRHRAHFAAWLAGFERQGRTLQADTIRAVGLEFENIRLAWARMIEQRRFTEIAGALEVLRAYCFVRGLNAEAHQAFTLARRVLEADGADTPFTRGLRVRLLLAEALFAFQIGRFAEAEAGARACLGPDQFGHDQFGQDQAGVTPVHRARALFILGKVEKEYGQREHARTHFLESLALAEAVGDLDAAARVLTLLAVMTDSLEQARDFIARACTHFEALGSEEGVAGALTTLGWVLQHRGLLIEAQDAARRGLERSERAGYRLGVATNLENLGEFAWKLGDAEQGMRLCFEGLEIFRAVGAPRGAASVLLTLGEIESAAGNARAAFGHLLEGFRLDLETGATVHAAEILSRIGELLERIGQARQARELLEAVGAHSGTEPWLRAQALERLRALGSRLPVQTAEDVGPPGFRPILAHLERLEQTLFSGSDPEMRVAHGVA